ncbi:superoxide dismutase family protein [Mycobacterium sp.]|uniref:superoxide dismutase[Cu-Zn] n=1 Tax=Mycobacterium sp. TaxID=1785 RepID=UPI0025EA80B9|nr:superoxide dismutase family protein [Mycobacterium sp.]MBW0012666.1 superoxide dismutase family protein [Mycobacterium sp.]
MTKLSAAVNLLLSVPVVAMSACSSPQHASTQTGTTPPVASGAPASSAAGPPAGGDSLTAQLKTADGRQVATATFDFSNGYATVTVKTVAAGILTPGFHEMHVHAIGKCEPNSVAPTGGPPGNFMSAGDPYQAPGHTGKPESGALTMLEVRQDGSAYLVTTTDGFTRDELLGANKTALMIHAADNSAMPMERMACGVIGTG